MQSNPDPKPSSPASKTDNITTAIEDAQLLLQYVAENGIAVDEHDLSVLIDSKFSWGALDVESEHLFWRSLYECDACRKTRDNPVAEGDKSILQ